MAILLAAGTLTYLYQDKLIALFVAELNKHLKAKVEVAKIELSLWDKFPQAAITLSGTTIMSSSDSSQKLAEAERLYFTFSLRDLWYKQYKIRELSMENGFIALEVDAAGTPNYLIYQSADTTKSEALSFDLEKISLKNVAVKYHNRQTKQLYDTHAENLVASLGISEKGMQIAANGNVLVKAITLDKQTWLRDKTVALNTKMLLDTEKQHLTIHPSELGIQKAVYALSGNVNYAKKPVLNLAVDAKNATLHGIIALLPTQISRKLAEYKSTGQVHFSAKVNGEVSDKKNPLVEVEFGCRNGSFYHPDLKVKLEDLNFAGSYSNGAKRNEKTSELKLTGLSGTLKGKKFSGDVLYTNFADPSLDLNVEADLDIASALAIYPVEGIQEAEGQAWIKLAFKGRIADLKSKAAGRIFKASGEVRLTNASFLFKDLALLLGKVNGRLQVNRNDFAVQDLSGKLGQSDFMLNGYFRNAVAWMLADQKNLMLEAELSSRFLNLDELLSQQPAAANNTGAKGQPEADYSLEFSPDLTFRLQSDIGKLRFRRLMARQVKGEIALNNQVLSSDALQLQALGGQINVKGSVDARGKLIKATTISRLNNIYLDSAMYVFEDFGQNFLQQRHLRGQLQADVVSDIFLDKNLNPQQKLLEADITASVKNGQLIKFAPIEQMSKYLKKDELSNLQFSELTNHIQIYNSTIHIPEMEIYTSLKTIPQLSVSGTHTLNQEFDYKVKIPLPRLHKVNVADTRFGNIEQEEVGTGNLFLTIKGNPDNFKVAYDKQRVKEKIKDDIKREGQELKDALQGKEKPKKEVQLNEGEYFDF